MNDMEIIKPNLSNFIKSLRDFGYTFSIAIADIVDNSIAANATEIFLDIALIDGELQLTILDNGVGMTEKELVEAMRLGSKDPHLERNKKDLGRFGLGLKTASFSQCKKLSVVTKKQNKEYARSWDLDYIEKTDEWYLLTYDKNESIDSSINNKFKNLNSGTLVIWDKIDGIKKSEYINELSDLRDHLALIFHQYLEGKSHRKKVKIYINNNEVEGFNPFNEKNLATQQLTEHMIKIDNKKILVTPYILPHHSKTTKSDYDLYATSEGYTKSQGFYLYRENRLLIHGTWWGLSKLSDSHRLVRVKIEIDNNQDYLWNIDVKKSTAQPDYRIKRELQKILKQILDRGQRTYTRRGRNIIDKSLTPFWEVVNDSETTSFKINQKHPLLENVLDKVEEEEQKLLKYYLKGLEAYIPLTTIQAHMISEPHKIKQEENFTDEDRRNLINNLKILGFTNEYIEKLMETEIYIGKKEDFENDK